MTLTFSIDTDQLKDMIEDKITYNYLDQHILTPDINIHKLLLLTIILEETSLPITIKKQYIIATTLVQIALDTHEHISNSSDIVDNEESRLSKQLAVLSGDYYSSLYYALLSESSDIPFIQTLASAIKDVNEYKMNLYFQTSTDINQYIKLGKKIESHIIHSVAKFVGYTNELNINMIIELLLLDLLIHEKENFNIKEQPLYFEHQQIKSQLYSMIDQKIETSINQIEQQLTLNDDQTTTKLIKVFQKITHRYLRSMEEG